MQRGCPLEVECFAGRFPLACKLFGEGLTCGFQSFQHTADFRVIFLLRSACKAGSEAHFHLRIDAAGEIRIAADFDLAPANLENIEEAFRKCVRHTARSKRANIKTFIGANAPRDVATGILVSEIDFQQRWGAQPHQIMVAPWEISACVLIERESLFEFRTCNPIANPRSHVTQIESLLKQLPGICSRRSAARRISAVRAR